MLAPNTPSAAIVAAFDAVPLAIFVLDAGRSGHANAYVNAAYSAFTGYGAAEALASGFDALSIFAEPAELAALLDAAEPPAVTRLAVRRRDGTTREARLHLETVPRETAGRYVVGMLEDAARAPGLAPPGAETAAGTRTFLSWLNHELRSPLNACNMWLDVLALAREPDKLAKAVDAIKRNLARQTRLVDVLNDAAKVRFDGIDVALGPLDLVPLLERELPAWQSLALAKSLNLEHRVELREAHIEGDADLLSQALSHVLENAIASTPSGGRVGLRAFQDGANCIVAVDDGGAALSEEDVANLGTALWRSPHSAKARSGLGLGLAVAHHIATKHGGTFTAASSTAATRFALALPLAAVGRGHESMGRPTRTADP